MEGKDQVFGGALENIIKSVEEQEATEKEALEAKAKKQGTEKPKELKPKDNKADTSKMQKLESKADEGIEPDENKDDEGKKIQKLTEKEKADLTASVKELVQKAKTAIDTGDYTEAEQLCGKLTQIRMAVAEPEDPSEEDVVVKEPISVETEVPVENKSDQASENTNNEKFIMDDKLQEMIDNALDAGGGFVMDEAKKKDPKAKTRNRGDVIFPADSSKVTDDKDHFPMNTEKQARNALAQANKYKDAPKWYNGSLTALVKKVATSVKKKYKDIEVTKAAEKPGKG